MHFESHRSCTCQKPRMPDWAQRKSHLLPRTPWWPSDPALSQVSQISPRSPCWLRGAPWFLRCCRAARECRACDGAAALSGQREAKYRARDLADRSAPSGFFRDNCTFYTQGTKIAPPRHHLWNCSNGPRRTGGSVVVLVSSPGTPATHSVIPLGFELKLSALSPSCLLANPPPPHPTPPQPPHPRPPTVTW